MDLCDSLDHLVRIDRDAVRAYTQAIDNVAAADVREMLTGFRADHLRHIDRLSAELSRRGRQPPQEAHLSGFALAGFTAIAAGISPSGALMAMQSNEVVTNQAYQIALEAPDLPAELRDLLEANLADEQRHLSAIRGWLQRSSPMGAALSGSAAIQGAGASLWLNVMRNNPVVTAVAATGAAVLLGNYLLGRRGGGRRHEHHPH